MRPIKRSPPHFLHDSGGKPQDLQYIFPTVESRISLSKQGLGRREDEQKNIHVNVGGKTMTSNTYIFKYINFAFSKVVDS